ncbi:MAG: hypothetical protein GY804_10115 [Alphaproteobacteria bacterium]|nr:hypothetical protein [Alphaproteobacteria bacterium]
MVEDGFKLAQGIITISEANSWDEAKLEWDLFGIYRTEEPETCLCGHYPIIEVCELINKKNGNRTIVGNVCVNRFLGLPSNIIFQAIRRVKKDNSKSLNSETIDHAYNKGWINDWEKDFYFNIMRKRKLTTKQCIKKEAVNNKLLSMMSRQ